MKDVHQDAKRILSASVCAALFVRPTTPAITEEQLKEIAIRSGVSPAIFDEVIFSFAEEHRQTDQEELAATMMDWRGFLSPRGSRIPRDLVPVGALKSLEQALERLDGRHGKSSVKSLAMFAAECPGVSADDLQLAIALLVSLRRLQVLGDGFRGELPPMGYHNGPTREEEDPLAARIRKQISIVKAVLSETAGNVAPESSALDRFTLHLTGQGHRGLAQWWAEQVRELRISGEQLPTASTVLAGALLECALVACAFPAKAGGQWRQKFLSNPPESWKLGQLIDQAESANTLSTADIAIARSIAEFRNRIHVGKYSAGGKVPNAIPAINMNEARLVVPNLERVLDRLLEWVESII